MEMNDGRARPTGIVASSAAPSTSCGIHAPTTKEEVGVKSLVQAVVRTTYMH